jgi:peptidase M24-like protein
MTVLGNTSSLDTAPRATDRAVKRQRVLQLMDQAGAESLLLTSAPAVNWYLDGARTHVSFAAPPIVAVEVNRDADLLHVTANERARLLEEELPTGVELRVREWWEPLSDRSVGEGALSEQLRALRADLLPGERLRFAQLGRNAATAVTEALEGASPRMSEFALAARVHGSLVERELEPLVVLVGGERRSGYRHPLPTTGPLGRRAMVVVCARHRGLIANLTRWVRFGARSETELDRDRRILEVEADAFAATRTGASLSDVLDEIGLAYPRHGFDVQEWTQHHQGGIAGYDGRDPRAIPSVRDVVPAAIHVAWNPSVPGAKVEDTVLVENGTVTPLTVDPSWPTELVRDVPRPSVCEL